MQEQQVAWKTGKVKAGRDSRKMQEQQVICQSETERQAVDSRKFCSS